MRKNNVITKLDFCAESRHSAVLAAGKCTHVVHHVGTALDCASRHRRQRDRRAHLRCRTGKPTDCGYSNVTHLLFVDLHSGVGGACHRKPATPKHSSHFSIGMNSFLSFIKIFKLFNSLYINNLMTDLYC